MTNKSGQRTLDGYKPKKRTAKSGGPRRSASTRYYRNCKVERVTTTVRDGKRTRSTSTWTTTKR